MKNVVKILAVLSIILILASAAQSQTVQKIGYIDFNGLVAAMPGVDSVKIKLQTYQKTLSDQLDAMRAEFENKYLEYRTCKGGLMRFSRKLKQICKPNNRNFYNPLF
jgi:Skp family chaperone for outer membrane proteins